MLRWTVVALLALALAATSALGGSTADCKAETSSDMETAAMMAIFSYKSVVCGSTFTVYAYVFCCGAQSVGTAVGVEATGMTSVYHAVCAMGSKRGVQELRVVRNATATEVDEALAMQRREVEVDESYSYGGPSSSTLPPGYSSPSPSSTYSTPDTSPCRTATPESAWTATGPTSTILPTYTPAVGGGENWYAQPMNGIPTFPPTPVPPTWANPAGDSTCSGCIPPHQPSSSVPVVSVGASSFKCSDLLNYLTCIRSPPCAADGAAPASSSSPASSSTCEQCMGTHDECSSIGFIAPTPVPTTGTTTGDSAGESTSDSTGGSSTSCGSRRDDSDCVDPPPETNVGTTDTKLDTKSETTPTDEYSLKSITITNDETEKSTTTTTKTDTSKYDDDPILDEYLKLTKPDIITKR